MQTDNHPANKSLNLQQLDKLAKQIKTWASELGFQQAGITDIDLQTDGTHLQHWLDRQFHGEMEYMSRHGSMRAQPEALVPGTLRIISVRMDYWPQDSGHAETILADNSKAYVSRYALGRDYHKIIRKRLQKLATQIQQAIGSFGYRVFTDSAPVLERALATKAGLGWIGKHTNLINENAGSWFFLGELFTDLPLPVDKPATAHCGTCSQCISCCPTDAIIAPNQLDARRCISYLTIELRSSIPVEFRKAIGNRIYGCDDCQLVCPWNRFAEASQENDFSPRHRLDSASLVTLFLWDEKTFLSNTEGSPIRRIGHESWLRNIAVALGNANTSAEIIHALQQRSHHSSAIVREHVEWALKQHDTKNL
ncbi:MAG: tRNA epoxyqueuosine(34) reductase QueG [Gammaproteobacteria bacterium]